MNAVPTVHVREAPAETGEGPVLQAHALSFQYVGAPPVFEGVSLQVAPREIVCLLGGSGCGKSTLLRVLARLETTHAARAEGQVDFLGQPLTSPHPRAALLFQQPSLLPWLDAARNVGFGLDFARQPALSKAALSQRVADALEAVGLAGQGGRYPAQLSGGMAQRVALARGLARQPQLLLADEPFSALDAITRAEMQELLVTLVDRWHTAALLVTHDIDEAIAVGDRILLMGGRPGRIVREWRVDIGRPREADAAAVTALRLDILTALHGVRQRAPAAAA
ncbi:ABC transporter ATP-binding protein [Variovorax sp. N23]|uniref:ABC transporter ATP-binding protein n=1 Tax=Variovorax sp. N23 TaxID=2980555 RepID=UPI0021C6C7E5|nr:ABC transporter ATP-binding protein [Variovorax sp. N23]MCU4120024.1 ABC transporter ATP-binding protein [Variovorax sp. N23]